MCGILGIFGSTLSDTELRRKLIEGLLRIRHRGPDWSGHYVGSCTGFAHERLAVINPESGAQPLYNMRKSIVVAANGEIYNCRYLYKMLPKPYLPTTESDCEIVIPLYESCDIADVASSLRGMIAFIIHNMETNTFAAI